MAASLLLLAGAAAAQKPPLGIAVAPPTPPSASGGAAPAVPPPKGIWICSMLRSMTFAAGSGFKPGTYKDVVLSAPGVPQQNEPVVDVTVGDSGTIVDVAIEGAGQSLTVGQELTGSVGGKTMTATVTDVGDALWGADPIKDARALPSRDACQ